MITYYATKKRVTEYIESRKGVFTDTAEFIRCLQEGIAELKEPKGFNPNQIRFFTKVLKQLQTN